MHADIRERLVKKDFQTNNLLRTELNLCQEVQAVWCMILHLFIDRE